jgi:hypothetical protein
MPADEPDPPRKFYELKPREFQRVNPPAALPRPGSLPAKKPAAPAPTGPITVQDLIQQANAAPARPGAGKPAAANDVHGHLRTNLESANAAGLNKIIPLAPRPSKRKRDYLLLMVVGNGGFLSLAAIGHSNPMLLVCGVSGAMVFTLGITWIMWVLMDRY